MSWTNIANALVAVGAKPFASTIQALRDNIVALADGDAGAPRIADVALSTTVTGSGVGWVGNRMAGLGVGGIGSYAICFQQVNIGAVVNGQVQAGSNLRYSNATGSVGAAPPGSWMHIGSGYPAGTGTVSLHQRVA